MRVPSPPQLRLQRRLLGTEVALGWAGRHPQAGPSLCPASSLCLGRPLQLAGGLPGWGRASSGDHGRWSWPQAGRRVQGRVLVMGSVWPLSPQGWPGHSTPPQQQEGGDCTLTFCPQKAGPVSPVLPLEVHWSGRASTPMDPGTGHLLGSRYQERWGQGGVPGGLKLLQPWASFPPAPALLIQRGRWARGRGSAAGHRAGPRPTSQLPAQSCGCHPRSGGLRTSRELCARGREAPEGRRAVQGALGPQP